MSKHKKLLTSAVALGTAAAMVLGGTFAWQSISQKATNEASDIVNPGGRLHNDQHWVSDLKNDTNIYVENFAEDTIYARVRLSEYMEIVMNYNNTAAQAVETVAGKKLLNGVEVTDKATDNTSGYTYQYDIHYFGKDNATDKFFSWTEGSDKSETVWYMPTFNKNKDSLLADLNGEYVDTLGGISNRGENQYTYESVTETSTAGGWEVYDGDKDIADDVTRAQLKDLIAKGTGADCYENLKSHIALVEAKGENAHTATQVGTTKDLISMSDWLQKVTENGYAEDGVLTDEGREAMYDYWVYDTDGWVYWSAPIEKGETTGLLLDSFELKDVMDDTWYYAIDVEAQFVTPDDVGKEDGTGFYTDINAGEGVNAVADGENETTEAAEPITESAEKLLALLGVYIPEDSEEDNGGSEQNPVTIYADASPNWYSKSNSVMEPVTLTAKGNYCTFSPYVYEKFDSETLANTQWELSGNTSADTKLENTTGETNTLTISTDETGELTVKTTITYNGYTNSGTTTITSEPHVASFDLFDTADEGHEQLYMSVDYVAGTTKTYELALFPKYTGGSYDYEERITGTPKENLAQDVKFTLADANNNDEATIEGVTISQSSEDKTLLTVTIAEGVTEKFSIRCEASGINGYATFKMKDVTPPTVTAEKADGGDNDYTLTVSGLTENDREMPINFYELTGATQDYSEGKNTYTGSLYHYGSFYGNIRELESDVCSVTLSNVSYDESTGTATITVAITNGSTNDCYLGISVADSSGNVGKIATPLTIKGQAADEDTAEEIVRTDAQEEGLKVTYKRKANAKYMAGSGTVEFKLKPEYNSTVLTDTGKLTLTVQEDGVNKAQVTGDALKTSSADGEGWLQCTVSDLFTGKGSNQEDIKVTLTLTYTDGDTSLTTEPYEITFTYGGKLS